MRQTLALLFALVLLAGCAGAAPTAPPSPEPTALPTVLLSATPLPQATSTPTALPEATLPATDQPAATATPDSLQSLVVVAWVRDGDLLLKHLPGGDDLILTNLGDVVYFPEFSPDGQLVLFHRQGPLVTISPDPGAEVPTSTLWAVPAGGGTPRQVLDPTADLPSVPGTGALASDLYPSEPGPLAWLSGGRQVLFSSRYLTVNGTVGNYDLWRLDLETGQLDALLPAGQGGRPTLSPDGAMVLLSTPTELAVAQANGAERRTLLTYERVPTYSEWEWLPEPTWSDDGSVHVALARPWQVSEAVTYALLRLDLASGQSRQLGEVEVSWLHTPLWSPDGSRLAYAAAGNGLVLAGSEGEGRRTIAAGDTLLPLAWSPAGSRLALVQEDQYCVVEATGDAEPLCATHVWDVRAEWTDEDTLVVMADAGEDQPQLQAIELTAGMTSELWTAPPAPLYYDLYVGR